MWKYFIAFAVLLASSAKADAQDKSNAPMPLEKQEEMEQYNRALRALKNLESTTNELTEIKKTQCIKAFGNLKFCTCIANQSPVGVDFVQYVAIVAGAKEQFKYDQLSPDDKKLFDATRRSRDECVK